MSKLAVAPVRRPDRTPPPVPQTATKPDDPSPEETPSALERAIALLGTSFGVSLVLHVAVLATLAFWVFRQPTIEVLITDAGLVATPDMGEIETLKLEMAPASVPKDDVSPLRSNVAVEAASSGTPGFEVGLPDVPGQGTAGGGNGEGIFGSGVGAKSFAFVVDCSSSMTTDERFQRAITELLRVVEKLRPDQRFFVVFYNRTAIPMFSQQAVMNFPVRITPKVRRRGRRGRLGRFGNALVRGANARNAGRNATVKRLLAATPANKRRARQWILKIRPTGGTLPREALQISLGLKPQVIYFLTDGEIPDETPRIIRENNRSKTVVHTVALGYEGSARVLKRIAKENGGRYTFAK